MIGAVFVPRPSPLVAVLMTWAVMNTVSKPTTVMIAMANHFFFVTSSEPITACLWAFAALCEYFALLAEYFERSVP